MAEFYNPLFEIDAEFSRLSFQREESYIICRQIIQSSGSAPSIIVWNGLVVDGHLKYRVCRELDLEFAYEELKYNTRAEVIRWRCNQLLKDKERLTDEQIRYCIGKLYLAEIDYAKYIKANNYQETVEQIPQKESSKQNKTAYKISQNILVSPWIVLLNSRHAKAIDTLFEKSIPIARAILNGDVSLSLNLMQILAEYPRKKLQSLELFFISQNGNYITMENIRSAAGQHYRSTKTEPKKEIIPDRIPQIKQMPVFDPDAAILSLAYTMPSWVNILKRAMDQTKFCELSFDTKDKLRQEMDNILEAIYKLSDEMEIQKNDR